MSFWRALLGRSAPVKPDLDALFGLPSAALTLRAGVGLTPTGSGSVAFRAAEGAAFADIERDVTALLNAGDGPPVEQSTDDYGYTWLVVRGSQATAGSPAATSWTPTSPDSSPTCTRSTPPWRPTATAPPCCAPWWVSPTRGPFGRPGLPVQARDLLPLRAQERQAAGQRAGTPGGGGDRGRPPDGEGPFPLVPGLRRPGPVKPAGAPGHRVRNASVLRSPGPVEMASGPRTNYPWRYEHTRASPRSHVHRAAEAAGRTQRPRGGMPHGIPALGPVEEDWTRPGGADPVRDRGRQTAATPFKRSFTT